MLKHTILAALAGTMLCAAQPLLAQDDDGATTGELDREFEAMSAMFGDIFGSADPLTAEQETRVPMAQSVVLKLFPEGTYARMMNETMAPIMDGIMGNVAGAPAIMLIELTGLPPSKLNTVDEADLNAAVALLDPSAKERNARIGQMTMRLISDMVVEIEPSYRAGLARAYAVRFTAEELADLDAYFATPVGSKYAAESFLIYADPQVMSAMNEMMPAMMEALPSMMGEIMEIAETYPKARTYSELSADEQAKLASFLGASREELEASEPEAEDENALQ